MLPRFLCPDLCSQEPRALPPSEAHHALHVLRLQPGDRLEVFDGQGTYGPATIQSVTKREVIILAEQLLTEPPPAAEIVLASAVPKGERFDWLIEKVTELGVTKFIPLITVRSTVDPRDSKLDRLRQTVVAACKQCRRNVLLNLAPPMTWSDLLAWSASGDFLVAHPGGNPLLAQSPRQTLSRVVLAVGPEGGFTEEELQAAITAGGRLVSLGPHVLRIETAGLAFASWALLPAQSNDDSCGKP